jgi:hypothetical protein
VCSKLSQLSQHSVDACTSLHQAGPAGCLCPNMSCQASVMKAPCVGVAACQQLQMAGPCQGLSVLLLDLGRILCGLLPQPHKPTMCVLVLSYVSVVNA